MPKTVKIKLSDVGRDHWGGVIECTEPRVLDAVLMEAKKHLLSRGVDVYEDGDITAGFRTVGHWERIPD